MTQPTRTIPKLSVPWSHSWRVDGSDLDVYMPSGYSTYPALAAHAASNGVGIIRINLLNGDHPSYKPGWEVRPGEFNWAGELITRDGNDDITSTLYSKTDSVPASSNIKKCLDACYSNDIKVYVTLGMWHQFTTNWNYNAYKLNRLNAGGNIEALGTAGVLSSNSEMWTNSTAKGWYKNRIDCWLNAFGDHEAVYAIDLGNEFMFTAAEANFQSWANEMVAYIWGQYGTHKPFITASTSDGDNWADSENDVYDEFSGGARMVTWHNYNNVYTLAQIKTYVDAFRADQNTYSYGGETKKWFFRVGEHWTWKEGPLPVPDATTDINIQGEPAPTSSYAYDTPPNEVDPYPDTRMYSFLAMVLDPTMHFTRFVQYLDGSGSGGLHDDPPRVAEIVKVAKDFYDNCPFHETEMDRHESNISTDGSFDFKASLLWPDEVLTFVLVGAGTQTVDFGVTGNWIMVTYKWEGDGSDGWERIEDNTTVDPSGVSINFGDYTDGFCPGFLLYAPPRGNLAAVLTP